MLYDLQKKMIDEKGKPFEHNDDHYYYIIHQIVLKNYIVFQIGRNVIIVKPFGNCENETENDSFNYTKSFTINITEEHNETLVIPGGKCKNDTKNDSNNNSDNDNGDILERKSITFHDLDNSSPFPNDLIVTHEFQKVRNDTNSIKHLRQHNSPSIKMENLGIYINSFINYNLKF